MSSNSTSNQSDVHYEISVKNTREQNGPLIDLPREVLANVLLNLPVSDICHVAQTCQTARNRIFCVGESAKSKVDLFWFTAFWRSLFERDSDQWQAFSSGISEKQNKKQAPAPSGFIEAWGRAFTDMLTNLTDIESEEDVNNNNNNNNDNSQSAEEKALFQKRHETPWTASTWYACYMLQYQENLRAKILAKKTMATPPAVTTMTPQSTTSSTSLSERWGAWSGLATGVHRIPWFGLGANGRAAKRFLYRMMNEPNLGLKLTRLHAGLGVLSHGLGSGVGFDVDGVELNCSVLAMPIGEKDSAPEAKAVLWRRLVQDAPAVVFILGPIDDSLIACQELESNLSDRWTNPDTPLVVISTYGFVEDEKNAAKVEASQNTTNNSSNSSTSTASSSSVSSKDISSIQTDDTRNDNDQHTCALMQTPSLRANPVAVASALRLSSLKRPWVVYTSHYKRMTNTTVALQWIVERVKEKAWSSRKLKVLK